LFFEAALNPSHAICARDMDGRLLGVAGFKTVEGALVGGSIGDMAHRLRKSHHNPDGGFVDALNISHDPAKGMDIHAFARAMVARQDPRLEEVISNRRIWTYARRSEGWRPYTGVNGHTLHAHFVVKNSHRNDRSPWFRSVTPFPTKPLPPPYAPPTPPPAPIAPQEDDDDMATYIRLSQKNHKHTGRVEAVTAVHRRWVPANELQLYTFLGGKIIDCRDVKSFNAWTSNKSPVGTNGIAGPI
jgi:hypothetical protein